MMEWGKFFDQAPETAAGVPVAAMRASMRGPAVFPTAAPGRPSVANWASPAGIERPPQLEMPDFSRQQGQGNEWTGLASQALGLADKFSEKSGKPDSFSEYMKKFDEQLASMRGDKEKMFAALGDLNKTTPLSASSRATGYGPGSDAAGNEGFNYNVGNLRMSKAGWAGKGQPYNGFETFNTPQAGASAMFSNLKTYAGEHPDMTVSGAITKWAPPSENNTSAYIGTVSKASGLDPNTPLAQVLASPEAAAKLMMAMAKVEKGSGLHAAFTPELFASVAGGKPAETGYEHGGRVRYLKSLVGD